MAATERRTHGGIRAGLKLGTAIALVVAAWFYLAPVQFGGHFAYFQIVGDSMEPTITRGDVVLLRTADRYVPGDIVAYTDPDLGTVMHRIRELDGEAFILRGDNRDVDDSYRPTEDEIVGRLWQRIPEAGNAMQSLQTPAGSIFFSGLTVVMGALSIGRRTRRGKVAKARRTRVGNAGNVGRLADRSSAGSRLLSAAGIALVVAMIAGAFVVTNDAARPVAHDLAYEHTGAFSYTGIAGLGVYDGNEVRTGDPVFTEMTRTVPITFDYELLGISEAARLEGTSGRIRLDATVSQDNGWRRNITLTDWTPFVGNQARVTGDLNLIEVLDLTRRMEALSGLVYPTYAVDVVATIEAGANVSGSPWEGTYQTEMSFLLSNQQLQPNQGFAPESMDAFNVTRNIVEPWSLTLPVVDFTIEWALMRAIAVAAGVTTLALVGTVLASTALAARRGEVALIEARYGALIVGAASTEVSLAGRRVEVRRIDDLVKMARQDGLFIVHEIEEWVDELDRLVRADRYHLVLPGVTYTYVVDGAGTR